MTKKKPGPGDETLRGAPGFAGGADSYAKPASANSVMGESRSAPPRVSSANLRAVAPEVSQGAWRERAFKPRAVLTPDEVCTGLETAVRQVLSSANLPAVAFQELRALWVPFLRQALEQAGGDGVDAWLQRVLKPPGRRAMDPLFDELVAHVSRLRATKDLAQFEEEALKAIHFVRKGLGLTQPRRLSFKQMERELEGKLEIDDLLLIRTSDESELNRRLAEIGKTLEQLRDQLKTRPGARPDGMYSNFTRLKAELRVLDAEIKVRVAR